jgi:hypothetical protein
MSKVSTAKTTSPTNRKWRKTKNVKDLEII